MRTFFFIFIISCFFVSNSFAQSLNLSEEAEISVLTIGPGNSLNDAFGHSAFRVKDKRKQIDLVYNYGIYDFNTPNFYTKFAQGKLNYLIGRNYYEDFYNSYVYQNRTIEEQILNLTDNEKQQIFDYLENNYKPENRAYLYDFFFDNCATRIKDVLIKNCNSDITFNEPENFQAKTFRTLIQNQLEANTWGSVGIDIALGSVIDRPATPEEHMFLPKFIHAFFKEATLDNGNKLVESNRLVFEKRELTEKSNFLISPLFVFSIIGLLIISITFLDYKNNKRSRILDIFIFACTGIIGVLLLLLWFATDHSSTAQNYNLLWAFALNIFMLKQVCKTRVNIRFVKYLKFLVIMLCLLTFHWIVGIQVFAIALLPLFIALAIRYVFLIWYYRK